MRQNYTTSSCKESSNYLTFSHRSLNIGLAESADIVIAISPSVRWLQRLRKDACLGAKERSLESNNSITSRAHRIRLIANGQFAVRGTDKVAA